MARLLYACRFEVPTADGLKPVVAAYNGWIQGHYRDRRGLPNFVYDMTASSPAEGLPADHTLQSEQFATQKGEVIRLVWAYPVDTDPGLEWRNEIRIGSLGEVCAVEHTISINSIDYMIMPARLALGSPGVIRYLCSQNAVKIGEMTVKATPYPMGADTVPQFLELLQSPKRRLPIVFISPYANGDPSELDADSMAQRLAGMAIVVRPTDVETTWDMGNEIGRTLSCFDGGARIYWPGFSVEDDPRAHHLFFGARIRTVGPTAIERAIERSIFAVSAFRFMADARLSEIVREAEQTQRQQRLEGQKDSSDWEVYALELDDKLSAATETITNLQFEIDNLRANQQVIFSARSPEEPEEEPDSAVEEPKSVEDACKRAQVKCQNLIVLDSALEAASKSPFKRPADILSALIDLDAIAAGAGGDILQQLKQRGWGKRSSMHISVTTKAKYGSSYKFDYDGQRQFFEPHITLGSGDANSCASIHFLVDRKRSKIVVGHVGMHLPNTKT